MDVTQLIFGSPADVVQLDIGPGERVRSYDFKGIRTCYVEGVVEAITEPMQGCPRYKLRIETRVFDGQKVPAEAPYAYPPVNGTRTTFGGVTNCVERIGDAGDTLH